MIAEIKKSVASGKITVPPSKSMSHRYLFCAALSKGTSVIKNISTSKDIIATLQVLTTLGAECNENNKEITIKGIDLENIKINGVADCIESGSTLRFVIPLFLLSKDEVTLTGNERLFERPLDIYKKICDKQGLLFEQKRNFLKVKGPLKAGTFEIDGNVSSQFISGLLFALPCLEGDSKIIIKEPFESKPYVYMTLSVLEKFGVKATIENNEINIKGKQNYKALTGEVEGDYSNSAFTEIFNYFGGDVKVSGLDENSLQGDKVYREHLMALDKGKAVIDITDCPDLAPILITFATFKHGGTFTGTKRLKIKESDRGYAIALELAKIGGKVSVLENEIIVEPSTLTKQTDILYGHNDHRIVMSLAVILTLIGGEIEGAEAVSKSYPDFFEHLEKLGIDITLTTRRNQQ